MLGASDPESAYASAVRMIGWSVVLGAAFAIVLLPLADVVPRAFTSDPLVLHEAAALWPYFVLMQPLGGAVFALDGTDVRLDLAVTLYEAALGAKVRVPTLDKPVEIGSVEQHLPDIAVAQQELDGPHIHAAFDQMRGKGVTQRMRADTTVQRRPAGGGRHGARAYPD